MPVIKQGDIVVSEDEHQRLLRKLGLVRSVIKGSKGVPRGERVCTSNGNIVQRPLEVSDMDIGHEINTAIEDHNPVQQRSK